MLNTILTGDVVLVNSWNSLNGVWLMQTHITQTARVPDKHARYVITTNIQLQLEKWWIASFACNIWSQEIPLGKTTESISGHMLTCLNLIVSRPWYGKGSANHFSQKTILQRHNCGCCWWPGVARKRHGIDLIHTEYSGFNTKGVGYVSVTMAIESVKITSM